MVTTQNKNNGMSDITYYFWLYDIYGHVVADREFSEIFKNHTERQIFAGLVQSFLKKASTDSECAFYHVINWYKKRSKNIEDHLFKVATLLQFCYLYDSYGSIIADKFLITHNQEMQSFVYTFITVNLRIDSAFFPQIQKYMKEHA